MEELKFNDLTDFYVHILPALKAGKKELDLNIREEDIWNYFLKTKWDNPLKMYLDQIIHDIFNIKKEELLFLNQKEQT